MRIHKLLKSKRTGSAIVLALLAVIILVIMGTGLLSLGLHGRMMASRTAAEISARCAADAGLAKALYEMNEKLKVRPWDENTLPYATNATLTNSDATFTYTITNNDYIYHVDVTGRGGRETKNISCTLALLGLFRNAVHAQDSLVLENGYLIDAYSSEQGPYGGVNALQPTSASTGEPNVVAMGSGTIYGEFLVDYGRALPTVSPPEGEEFAVSKGIITDTITISENGTYDYINLKSDAIITISGDVTLYVTGLFETKTFSDVVILPDSSLTLYLGGNMNLRNTSTVNNVTQEPKRCQVYGVGGEGQTFLFEQSAIFHGTIYAPDADIIMDNSATLYGAIISNNAELRNSCELHFDATLLRASVDDLGAEFVVQHWQED